MDHADGDCVIMFPGVVADQPGEHIEGEQDCQSPAARWHWNPLEAGVRRLHWHLERIRLNVR
jgi:hypothetical protein